MKASWVMSVVALASATEADAKFAGVNPTGGIDTLRKTHGPRRVPSD
jgi:hypothetical protein